MTTRRQDLPNELWIDAWLYLRMQDRFAVAQVCRKWRTLVLQTHSLWTHLDFYTTRHDVDCRCKDCFRDRPFATYDSGWVNSPYPANSSNELLICKVLARSGSLPLHLHLDIVPYSSDPGTVSALAMTLQPHIDRLISISILGPNGHTMSHLLSYFKCLPALRTLRLSLAPGCENMWCSDLPNFFVTYPIDLPRLAVLDMRGMCVHKWPADLLPSLHFPNVRSLAFQTILMDDVILALRACPSVSSLRYILPIDQEMTAPYEYVDIQEMRDALASVRSCRVEGVWSADEYSMLAGFATMDATSLVLEYVEYPERGFEILRDAAPAPILLALADDGLVSLSADGARKRHVIFPAKRDMPEQSDFWSIWNAARVVDGVRSVEHEDAIWVDFVEKRGLEARRRESD